MLRDVPKLQGIDRTELTALINAVDKQNPEKADVARLKTVLDNNPDVYLNALSMSDRTLRTAIEWATGGKHPALEDIYTREIDSLAQGLGYDHSTVIEQMLIKSILLAWIRLQAIERLVLFNDTGPNSFEVVEYYDTRLTQAQRRFLRATEALARIRRLMQPREPQTQVNINSDRGVQMIKTAIMSGIHKGQEIVKQANSTRRIPAKNARTSKSRTKSR